MKIIDVEQGTFEWQAARRGIPTASNFHKILSPTGLASKQWEGYANFILAEEIVGHSIETYKSNAMIEGNRREAESVAFYEFANSIDTVAVGFITDDLRTMGYSPDRLVGDEGLLELKNPEPQTHVDYLFDMQQVAREYWPQVQGGLLITARKWCDVVSYYPEMPPVCVRIGRDEKYIAALDAGLKDFNRKLAQRRAKLIELGHLKPIENPAKYLAAG